MGEPDQLRFLVATPIFNFWVRIGLLLLLLLIFQHLMPEKGGESSVAARPEPQRCDCKKFCYIRKFYDNIVSRTTFVQLPHKQPKHDYKNISWYRIVPKFCGIISHASAQCMNRTQNQTHKHKF